MGVGGVKCPMNERLEDRRFGGDPIATIATREEAQRQLDAFVPLAGSAYARTRNEDRGPGAHDNVSRVSPYLRRRIITEAEVIAAVRARFAPSTCAKFVDEVLWRTYWKGWLEQHPETWTRYEDAVGRVLAPERCEAIDAAERGATGIPGFDDWARELVATNYLHNHARMWFASIWIFTLQLPWECGAAFFLRHLLDGDAASNTLSWRWVAGLHTRGKTYRARRENIVRYTAGRIDPGDTLAPTAPALDDPPIAAVPLGAPPPAPRGPIVLVLHEDDLGVETLELDGADVVAVAALAPQGDRAAAVETFAQSALGDALARASACFGVPAVSLSTGRALAPLAAPYAPLGPTREALDPLGVAWIMRSWDARLWPFARAGFFTFRERALRSLAKMDA
jgi:deoxyribodipyrimidine photo-lyase